MESFKPSFVAKNKRKATHDEPVIQERSRSPRYIPRKVSEKLEPMPVQKERKKKSLQEEWDVSEDTYTQNDDLYANMLMPRRFRQDDLGEDGSSKAPDSMSKRDWKIFREDQSIKVKGNAPHPIRSWSEGNLDNRIMRALNGLSYREPTPIQMQAISVGLNMQDLLALAPTGSGKSAAYLLPLLSFVLKLPPIPANSQEGPYGLVIAPTRELAIQIEKQALDLGKHLPIRFGCLVGGRSIEVQSSEIISGIEIIIGTPGRILDCLERNYLVLSQCYWLVIDEADKLILLELENTLAKILEMFPESLIKDECPEECEENMRNGRQFFRVTQLFSATMDKEIEQIWKSCLRSPVYVSIGDTSSGSEHIKQTVIFLTENEKNKKVKEIITNSEKPIIVFASQRTRCDALVDSLRASGINAYALHGGKSQENREKIMSKFKRKKIGVLVATDLASRGLDVLDLKCVINYDAPSSIVDYEHRIGRTGRMGKDGKAYVFITADDEAFLPSLKDFLRKNKQFIPAGLQNIQASETIIY